MSCCAAATAWGAVVDEFCDRRILARIHRSTIDSLRSQVEPVSPAAFIRFLLDWQHVMPEAKAHGEGGLLAVIEKLQGFETAAGVVEEEVLGNRVAEYSGLMLDRLCLSGEVVWGRFSPRIPSQQTFGHNGASNGRAAFSRSTPVAMGLRESLDWLLPEEPAAAEGLTGAAQEIFEYLQDRGASFISDITAATKRLPSDVEEALWTLVASGIATTDGLEAMRQRLRGTKRPRRAAASKAARQRRSFSRWSLLEASDPVEDRTEAIARQLLLRYGILFPELLARDSLAVRWRDMARVLRRLEARGEIRGGRFVTGFVGEQFALPEAVDALRRWRNREPDDRIVIVSACDPLNLAGVLTPGQRVPSVPGNRIAYRNGVPVAAMEGGEFVALATVSRDIASSGVLEKAKTLLSVPIPHANFRLEHEAAVTA